MRSVRILVVEDEPVVSREIAERLNALGYKAVGRAASGERCLDLVELERPDLVLMDIRIKGAMDGVQAAHEIRRRFHTPVIFLTAYSEDATLERAKLAEPYACIFKPVADRDLKSAIEIALYKHRAEEEIRRLNRLYDVLSQVNQSVARVQSREEMLSGVCRIIVERGEIDLAWIGWLDPDSSRIIPIAQFGERCEMLREVEFLAQSGTEAQGNPGQAICEGRTVVCNDCGRSPCSYPLAKAPSRFGFQSCGSFPLRFQGRVCGVLGICTVQHGFLGEREIHLFEEIAIDVSFALDKIEAERQRIRAETALRESNERLEALFERARDAILLADPESGVIVEANKEAESLLGRPRSEIIGLHFSRIHPPELREKHQHGFSVHATSREMLLIEAEVQRPDGSRIPVEVSGGLVELGNGQRVVQGLFRDISARKAAEEEAGRQKGMLLKVFESAPLIMMLVDTDVRVKNINRTGEAFAGRPREQLLDKLCGEALNCVSALGEVGCGADEPCAVCPLRTRVAQTFSTGSSIHDAEGSITVHSGSGGLPVDMLISTALIQGMEPGLVLVTITDITERKKAEREREKLEAQLREAQKLEAIGTLAGGIAHDFNNILAPILGYTEMALMELTAGDSLRDLLEQVLKAGNRAKDLVQQILAFSRHEKERPLIPMNVGLIAKEALKLLRATLPSTIEIRQDIERGVASVDGTQIHQVIVNLCTNAAHAMEDGGLLAISLKGMLLNEEDLEAFAVRDLRPGPYLRLRVSDSGHGMDEETLQRIFDPYFTTKEVGKGTGLGLSVVHGIVKRHGGKILVRSEREKGTVFDVYLPAEESEPKRPAAILENLPRGTERILLVDDEEMVAHMAARMLTRLGYKVTSRTDAGLALEHFRSHPRDFDLVVSDYTMPGMTGIDLAREILRERSDMPIILCTGYDEKLMEEKARRIGVREVTMKPLNRDKLAALVRMVLDSEFFGGGRAG